jgi:pSer/pThr/pTyr-binding forkhead associated (FHA) protein
MASVTVIFGGQEQKTYPLDKSRMVVGREPKCEIHIDNLGISREHCAFSQRGEAFLVQDLNSSNGTYVNGKKITEHFLNHDDEIIIGKYMLKFKNEAQDVLKEKKQEDSAPVPDTLNTYVMDGPKIQQQLAKMRSDKKVEGQLEAAVAKPPMGVTARDYAKAMDVAPEKKGGSAGKIIIILLVLFFLFLLMAVAAAAVWYFYLRR